MTKFLLSTFLSGKWRLYLLSLITVLITLTAQAQKSVECGESCFETNMLSLKETKGGCLVYELEVSFEGDCKHALSHYSLEMGCGVFSNASNSEGWPMKLNKTDPTSGITGLKVDEISEFGDNSSLENFTVTFTFCPTNCEADKTCFDPTVAYKAGQCIYREEVDAQCILPLQVIENKSDLSCAQADDGSISLDISGAVEPYQVGWDNGMIGPFLTNLNAGVYTYTVTSHDGQSFNGDVTLNSPEEILIEGVVNQPSCITRESGSISLTVSGGNGPYIISWDDGENKAERSGLTSGIYQVLVTDHAGCSVSKSFEINDQVAFSITADVIQPSCATTLGSISLKPSGGESPYTYLWSDGNTGSERSGLSEGIYSVKVTDALGCQTEDSFEIVKASQLTLSPTITHPTCSLSNGSLEIIAEGGKAPYTYEWKHGVTGSSLSELSEGYYMLTVTDANGCQRVASYALVAQTNLYLSAKPTNSNCQNDPVGAVDLTVYGGSAPFSYQWNNGATTEDISELTEGEYKVTVTDAIGCTATLTQEVKRNTFFVLSKVDHQICDKPGTIDLTVYYAKEPLQYEWNNGATSEDLTDLTPGEYSVIISDGTGCQVVRSFSIYNSNNLGLSFNATTEGCGDQISYNLEGEAVGGTAPFSYLWSDGSTNSTLTDVQPGTYELTISDVNGCSRTSSYTVEAQSETADCLIQTIGTSPECGSSGNSMSTDMTDAQSYQWYVTSSDGLWSIEQGANSEQISYTAGGENSTATFTLELATASGCLVVCSYDVNSCTLGTADNGTSGDGSSGGDTGAGDGSTDDGSTGDGSTGDNGSGDGSTGDGTSGDGSSGEDTGTGDGSTDDGSTGNSSEGACVDCFTAKVEAADKQNDLFTYKINISTDLSCKFDLSNLVIDIPDCAEIENFSNSMGWKMEFVVNDKNTGLTGVKVEGIPLFGKDASLTDFSVSLSLRAADEQCKQALECWSPQVAFKAGQCVTYDQTDGNCITQDLIINAYPNPTSSVIRLSTDAYQPGEIFTLKMYDTQGNVIRKFTDLSIEDVKMLSISVDNINTTFVYLRINGTEGSQWSTKVMINK